jgi:glycosyltransferase involved in cell wall biosynthesis
MPHSTQPTVSVAIATYNGEKFFFEQLESIRQQTVVPDEIVISDDNSSDDTLAVVDGALPPQWRQDHGVALKILRNSKALGPGKNFEQAMSACTSDLIACADQDDLWVADKLAVFVEVFSKNAHALLVHSDAELVDSKGTPMGMSLSQGLAVSATELEALHSGHSLPAIIKRNLVTGATMMVKKELLALAFPLPGEELHDGWLALVASLLDALVFVPEKLLHYRQHDSNQIGGKPMGVLDSVVAVQKSWIDMAAVLKAHNQDHRELLERLGDRVSEDNKHIVFDRIAHNAWRIGLPTSRIFRVWPALWGFMRGRYAKYGRQPHDVLRDLLMPPHELLLGFYRRLSNRKH